jgi:hypothetical protein
VVVDSKQSLVNKVWLTGIIATLRVVTADGRQLRKEDTYLIGTET